MTSVKKLGWSASSVALSALLAIAMLMSMAPKSAEAALSAVSFTAPIEAVGLTETWTVSVTTGTTVPIGGTITIDFPTSFTTSGVTASSITTTGFGGATCSSVDVSTQGRIICTVATSATGAAAGTIVIPGIKNPPTNAALTAATTPTATAGFSVTTSVEPVVAAAAAPQIWDVAITKSPSSVPADGASTVGLTIKASNGTASTNTGSGTAQVITVETTGGTFTAASPATGTIATAGTSTLVTGSKQVTMDVQAAVINTTGETLTLKAPATAGSATITVKVTPSTGGAAVLIGITTVSFTTPTALPGAPVSGSVSPTTTINVTSTGTTATITATFVDSAGNAPIPGGTVSVNTTLGVLTAGAGLTSCTNQSCTGSLASDGKAAVTLTGGGVPGTATITFTTGGISVTKTVTITGAVDTLTATVQADADGAGTGTAFTNASTPGTGTFGAGGGVRVLVDPKDSAGNRVPSVSPAITVSPSGCVTVGATTASTSTLGATTVLTAGSGTTGSTCTLTATVGTKTTTVTLTLGATLASTSTLEIGAADMATVATQTITVTVKSSSGQLVQDGTSVTLVVSAGAVATSTVLTVDGVATFTYVSPGTAQQVNLTAVAGSVTASKAIGVGVAGPSTGAGSGDGTFATEPSFGTGNVGSAVFNGGSIDQLSAAVTAAGGTSVWVQGTDGNWYRYNTLASGATAFVNNAFIAQFEAGLGTVAVFVVK